MTKPLPGLRAQAEFAPELSLGRHLGPPAHDARHAAVVALIYPIAGEPNIALTLRPRSMQSHAGQVCLPGGMLERGESPPQAAVRELNEELGVCVQTDEILGTLSPIFVFASNFLVTPFVAYLDVRPIFSPSSDEVEKLIELPVSYLQDPTIETIQIRRGPVAFSAPCFRYLDSKIWGATTIMLAELADVIASARS